MQAVIFPFEYPTPSIIMAAWKHRSTYSTQTTQRKFLLLGPHRVRALASEGRLPHIVLPGGEIRFDGRDLAEFVENLKRCTNAGGPSGDREAAR